jgi:hypothetical protein
MKKNNYFAVHKNKKPKRKLEAINWKPIYAAISKATELVKSLVDLKKAMYDLQMVRICSELKKEPAIVGTDYQPEMIMNSFQRNPIAGVAVEEFKVPISDLSDLSDHYLDKLRMNQPISNLDYFKK